MEHLVNLTRTYIENATTMASNYKAEFAIMGVTMSIGIKMGNQLVVIGGFGQQTDLIETSLKTAQHFMNAGKADDNENETKRG